MPEDLAEVYQTTYRALVRFLYRKVWSAERAEDLAQEAFARALVHKPENTRGWLFVVAANMARDEARRAARERRHLTLLKSEPPPSAAPSDRKSTRLNSSHEWISYAVFCLKKKKPARTAPSPCGCEPAAS